MNRILVTGGAGFIGSNFVRYMLRQQPDIEIVVLDKLTYAGRKENLQGVMDKIEFVKGDICDEDIVKKVMKDSDVVFNFAAETHVDRSIDDPEIFIRTDILGVNNLLDVSRKFDLEKFVQISTDEVYGSVENGSFKENDKLDPSSPYSASKAGADMVANAYFKTYGVPTIITRSSNNYGPFQFPEKLIPVLVINAMENKPLKIYGDGKNVRDWLFVLDNCDAIKLISEKGGIGEIYNIGSGQEKENIEVAKLVIKELKKSEDLIEFVPDRPGHDFRYSLDFTKLRKLGWEPKTSFEEGIKKTVSWYVENKWWWKDLIKS